MAEKPIEQAVVGADFGPSGDEAILQGLKFLAGAPGRVLNVLYALDAEDVLEDAERPSALSEQEVLERAPTLLRERMEQLALANELPFPRERVRTHARIGKAVDAVLQLAAESDADLIIVGTHGRRGIDRLVLGSVAEKLVRTAHCPVLVARRKDYGSEADQKAGRTQGASSKEPAPYVRVRSEDEGWEPAGGRPTGIRIV
jgi:nucleotide-binding universal stress UspA family protein